jgi:predicted small secreted protein
MQDMTSDDAMIARFGVMVLVAALLLGLSACSGTWRGLKQDTGENLQATGAAIEKAGEKVKPSP